MERNAPPRVLHLCSYYCGTDLYRNMVEALQARGVENRVYCPVDALPDAVARTSFALDVSPCFSRWSRADFFHKNRLIQQDMATRYRLADYDVLHAHTLFTNGYAAYRAHQQYGIRYIVAVRNTDVNTFFKYMVHLRGLGNRILDGAQAVVFLSPAYRDGVLKTYVHPALREKIAAKAHCIPNGIDPFWHRHGAAQADLPDAIRVLYAGVIDRNKNVTATLRALDLLRGRGRDVCFTVAGAVRDDGIARQLRAREYVRLAGSVNKETLIGLYRQNQAFVMPSLRETFGLVYAEALSQGVPVLYSAGQGFDGQFPPGQVGYPVDPLDPADIAQKILLCRQDFAALSRRANEASRRFDWARIAGAYAALYRAEG
ncbi:MAG: glycosyltransferase family 4 protein [Eubacteriales bacterium]|nr:glycosyltransferase family 4 protein [Eubacteriales bacterium]